ncbi:MULTISPECIES: MetQ/NlpA family lipoprotein [unclassified Mesorhizobium]|uniref:MetQ/NlpA family lipoprotein n=1 Tax=unclassified Mesorhizobium TaxID=325217 RepID=UPI000FDC1D73|nr:MULTISPECIES: MetQ/NlpA family lipoprotein [unclassified Mesorhizobium]TGQ38458.1 metal ABC transporter substrate-binding protein [Mesorhizobium sp. M00.F.Ca.ET.216.01.1.1]TIS53587.1 MAG: metal ABC transporter substrate-binding protein [Mesorhizobium sp.]TIS85905.1 MAG: metal ABC transporter substrate-binding protein [Mesorhizobium sp.]TJW05651.1 MAG: metal ABC transporter substrate-binding protein [Mesorhizobium sp.]TJW44600.1 MAG: metal ABC transporter substrate-binding protein [Mesorhizo
MSERGNASTPLISSVVTRRAGLAALLASALAIVGLAAPNQSFAEDKKAIKVGIISGEDEDVWRVVTAEGAKRGLTIETVVFNDYTQPNEALERGEIDANAFQHKPYLDNQIKQQGYHIVPVGYTGVWPIGLYSKKYAKVADLPEGAVIGLPNDPSNEGRALRVLQNEGIIKLKHGTGILATTADIADNPKKVAVKELDAGIVGRSVEDLDAAVVNTDWALKSGLTPENRIAQEPVADNPYRNFIAVKAGSENEPWVKTLVASYQNETVKAEFDRVYKGTGLSAY